MRRIPDAAAQAIEIADAVALVPVTGEGPPALHGHVDSSRDGECPTAFSQPRWSGYTAFNLAMTDRGDGGSPDVTLAIRSSVQWTRNQNGRPSADLDGDGVAEEARRCAADEGEHFTIWSGAADGPPALRAHEYFDWGAIVEATCGPGESGGN